ncbi:2-C-methyl-D-erythritol 4-phosphate cytidylyltransferase [Ruminococcus sp. YE71]|uniref:IspD/TarI family cytidylyltransferase n=1 Tax=unclassified Ruminococcus TaxID=2608920 RepID=UPI0008886354|nr:MULTISPECIES: IspD/TarI family cytidylyltransferase [unclassified Ruminococcus]SDA09641.1 2-C-methyl-D-erythritol 4-phosphate cytidylyltransferase [Ruminococcus sp. YE78]SFW11717.1 2-C-methyl-D-erythritol 4-phosphate cytidylyltransferase [Ruminococcus sp. YE71]
MIYGAMLAGGSGTRVKSSNVPKQFVEIGGKPIIVHTLINMLKVQRFDYIFIAAREDFIEYLEAKVAEFVKDSHRVKIIPGGKERMDSIRNITDAIEREFGVGEDDVIVIHDAVRPFVTEKILNDSIDAAAKYGACVCGLPCADTILHSVKGDVVDDIPVRSELFCGQAPDSFGLKHFLEMQDALTPEQKAVITGTSQICTMNGQPIHIIEGDAINFKITTDSDLLMVKTLLGMRR